MVRNLYLFHFGGVYADLDMECLRPLDDLLDRPNAKDNEGTAYVGRMEARKDHLNESIPNAWMASSAPQHPLWLLPLDFIVKTAANHGKIKHPESLTGPRPLREAVLGFQQSERWKVIVLEPRCIFPYSWSSHTSKQRAVCSAMEPGLDTKACQALFEEERPYCITYWAQRCARSSSSPQQGGLMSLYSWRHVNWDVLEGKKGR